MALNPKFCFIQLCLKSLTFNPFFNPLFVFAETLITVILRLVSEWPVRLFSLSVISFGVLFFFFLLLKSLALPYYFSNRYHDFASV